MQGGQLADFIQLIGLEEADDIWVINEQANSK